ncbi:hypothetical protein HanPSC8_Chr08g0315651 [Helianthus annuus]|nr:hypothetical protein HanPSC8_Chr08g0315651 [Helianthus annuus]
MIFKLLIGAMSHEWSFAGSLCIAGATLMVIVVIVIVKCNGHLTLVLTSNFHF